MSIFQCDSYHFDMYAEKVREITIIFLLKFSYKVIDILTDLYIKMLYNGVKLHDK